MLAVRVAGRVRVKTNQRVVNVLCDLLSEKGETTGLRETISSTYWTEGKDSPVEWYGDWGETLMSQDFEEVEYEGPAYVPRVLKSGQVFLDLTDSANQLVLLDEVSPSILSGFICSVTRCPAEARVMLESVLEGMLDKSYTEDTITLVRETIPDL